MKETTNYMKLTVIKTFKRTRKRKNVLVSSNNRDKNMKVEEYRKCSEKNQLYQLGLRAGEEELEISLEYLGP